jgi:hypothetical protein
MQYKAEAIIGFGFNSQLSSQHTRKNKEIIYKSIKLLGLRTFMQRLERAR